MFHPPAIFAKKNPDIKGLTEKKDIYGLIRALNSPDLEVHTAAAKALGTLGPEAVDDLAKEVRATAMLIGPGLWREHETFQAILQIIEQTDLPMVIDADAIRAVGTQPVVLAQKKAVLTPHSDEFRALTGNTPSQDVKERSEKVKLAANELGVIILLKGAVDIISDGDFVALNRTHTNLMTKGGMGDTLAGICGALLARGVEPYTAAQAAAYINGKAGLLAAKEFGEGMIPKDLIERIPKVIKGK